MSLTLNEDTYVLADESDSLLSEVLPASNPLRISWAVLDEHEKESFLKSALRRLEGLNVVGEKARFHQALKFPRLTRGVPYDFNSAPLEVKRAQVVWALEILREELYEKKRNESACVALGILNKPTATETSQNGYKTPKLVKELMHKWITQWRRL